MANKNERNGQREYGIYHAVEEEMREKGLGVYANKARKAAPSNKEPPSLSGMTKDELIAQAKAEGVDLSGASNNDERRAAIEAARK